MRFFAKCFLVCGMVILAASIVSADLYIESVITGGPGRETPDTVKTYLSDQGIRTETGDDTAMVVNYKEEKFYQVDLKNKTYTEIKFEDFLKPKDEKETEMLEQMQKMLDQMIDSMEVEKTEETQEINGYKCTKYVVSIMGSTSDYWITKDVPEHEKMVKVADGYKEIFKKSPILNNIATGFDMQKKMDGLPIKVVNKMMGMEIVQEVNKIETKTLDKSLFQAPEGFKKENGDNGDEKEKSSDN